MKSFFKTFFASLLAFVAGAGCLVFFLFAGLIATVGGIMSLGSSSFGSNTSEPVEVKNQTILKIDLNEISEISSEDPFSLFSSADSKELVSLSQATKAIKLAKNNPHIIGIYLNVEGIKAGLASIDELRRSLLDFKASRKPIIAYADSYTQKAYYLASLADRILLNPQGSVFLTGIASGTIFYKDALDKLGVKMEVFKVGTFKSAVEPYLMNQMSDANRLQVQEYIDGLWASVVSGIAEGRKLSPDSIRAFADSGRALGDAVELVKSKLVDTLVYRSDVRDVFAGKLKVEPKELRMIGLNDMARQPSGDENRADKTIKVVFAEGEIVDEELSPYSLNRGATIGYSLAKQLRELRDDDDTHAVVLRINSPGGSAFLSEQIWREVKELKAKKPVVVSMGDLAASGGYYIASGASYIVAEENTLTGSIGIFGLIPNLSNLAERFGVHMDIVKTSKYADLEVGLPIRPMTEEQKMLIQRAIERGYDTFIGRVAEGRKMTKEQVDSLGQGRVWLGKRALALKLVDKLGGLDTAIKDAARLAKLSDYSVDYGETSKNPFLELFRGSGSTNDFVAGLRGLFLSEEEKQALKMVQGLMRYTGIQTRLPYEMQVY